MLGLALIEQGKVSDAVPHINKANELDPSGENKLALARLQVAQKEFDKADETIKDASGDELEYVRGLVHLNRNRYKEAAEDFESFIQKNPEHAYAHYYAGLAYNALKRPDQMLSHFEHFVRMKPDAPEARKVRAVLKTGR
jgi:tetratricopeptide (TPR) repeat protein